MLASDRGEVISSWLVKITVVLALIGIAAFDGISCMVLRMQTQDAAQSAAASALPSNSARTSPKAAYETAQATLTEEHPGWTIDPASVTVGPDGAITLSVTGEAKTLVLGRIKQLKKYTFDTSAATSRPAS